MSKGQDGAFLLWARDWLTDEQLVLMSAAAKGCFIDLLAHCWLEGSVPACSEHLARIVRLDARAFADVWRELAPRFRPHVDLPDRLVNGRMEDERRAADERRKARQDKAKRAAEARWGRQPVGAASNARRSARSNARSMPGAVLEECPPIQSREENPPTPQRGGVANDPEQRERAARAQNPEPETRAEAPPPVAASSDVESQLQAALLQSRYRERVPAMKRRFVLRNDARRFAATGLDAPMLEQLQQLAGERGKDPGALLAHWLDHNLWREVLDEQGRIAKESGARGRAGAAPTDVHGQVIVAEPQRAASVVGDLLRKVTVAS